MTRACGLAVAAVTFAWAVGITTAHAAAGSSVGSAEWSTYSGDYTGRRYSALAQINQSNVRHLSLAWVARLRSGAEAQGDGVLTPVGAPTIVGGVVEKPVFVGGLFPSLGPANVRGAILEVGGVLYATSPDNAWAIDARTGAAIWHYYWKTKGGTHTANKGLGIYHGTLFMETADDYLVALNAQTGREEWHRVIADFSKQYFSEAAPIVIAGHVLVGTGNDSDEPGMLRSYDPVTSKVQWTYYPVPMRQGAPGLKTWPSLGAARHGGGNIWEAGSYDPETHLYIFGTGNPSPGFGGVRKGDNLFTCSLVAVNIDTGKMAWYYQTSPHDTHDWDSTQVPILVDAPFDGKPRKLVLQATRNGFFFVLDRVTGAHLLTSRFLQWGNWTLGLNSKGQPIPNPEKEATVAGTVTNVNGWTNWPPAAFDPRTGLIYIRDLENLGLLYRTERDSDKFTALGGISRGGNVSFGSFLTAIEYQTGRVAWRDRFEPGIGTQGALGTGFLATAGDLLFGSDNGENFIAFDPATGKALWHSRLHAVSNAPEAYMLDRQEYVIVAAGDSIYAFTLE
jgi:alcohol dehydrogenase (cytochrome c)